MATATLVSTCRAICSLRHMAMCSCAASAMRSTSCNASSESPPNESATKGMKVAPTWRRMRSYFLRLLRALARATVMGLPPATRVTYEGASGWLICTSDSRYSPWNTRRRSGRSRLPGRRPCTSMSACPPSIHAVSHVDISNAFNSCDRGRILRELYSTPLLSPLHRMAHFAYSTPSVLLLERGEGRAICSRNGVRQGDPLSALLFCLYVREVLAKVAERADVTLYGFFDDLNIVGAPVDVLKAFDALRVDLLPAVSLRCNTSKSHFTYFHDDATPLLRSQRQALADHDVQFHDRWVPVLGAVVGKDDAAIIDGVACTYNDDPSRAAFFRRLQLERTALQQCTSSPAQQWRTAAQSSTTLYAASVHRTTCDQLR